MKKKDREIRTLLSSTIVKDENERKVLQGFIPYNTRSVDMGFKEVITPSAFNKTINDRADVLALVNHDTGKVLGRIRNNTLQLDSREDGLYITVELPETSYAMDAYELVRSGYNTNLSFGFIPIVTDWMTEGDEDVRYLKEVKLLEVSFCVSMPAYEGTTSNVLRSLNIDQITAALNNKDIDEEDIHKIEELNQQLTRFFNDREPVKEETTSAVEDTDAGDEQFYETILQKLRELKK